MTGLANGKKKAKQNHYQTTNTVHKQEPDYGRPLFEAPIDIRKKMRDRLARLYGDAIAEKYIIELERIIKVYYAHKNEEMIEREKRFVPNDRFSEEDVILITYGDLLRKKGRSPLHTLAEFCDNYIQGAINTLHILPFFPYSSDRGFSIVDFETVDPNLGTWADIEDLEHRYQMMFDGVINHISSKSRWFQEFLDGNPAYQDFFIWFKSRDELTPEQRELIFRPRTSDVLTKFDTINGPRWVWTTFSEDQIDLNFSNPEVLMRVLEVLLLYVRHGADIIRLDAVTYLWEEVGTTCVHLDQTHEIVRLFRDVLNCVAPAAAIITETNVPHNENISYFGNGRDEAQMVYNFALPPLLLHTFYTEDATAFSNWAAGLTTPSDTTTFFNFLDSHDGVGLLAAKNILTHDEIDNMVKHAQALGGLVSYKAGPGGVEEPYEINVTWYSALNRRKDGEDAAFKVKRFSASRAVALALPGVPGIYLHSLFGTRNDLEGVLMSQSKRAINRLVIDYERVMARAERPTSKVALIAENLGRLLAVRTKKRAFHPNGPHKVLQITPEIFTIMRTAPEGDQHVLCLTSIANRVCQINVPMDEIGVPAPVWHDLLNGNDWPVKGDNLHLTLLPYDVVWLTPKEEVEQDDD